MLIHEGGLLKAGFTLILFLISAVVLDITASGQKRTVRKKEAIEIVAGTLEAPESPIDVEVMIALDPCKGEQPGNVLGISEQAPAPQRVAGFIKKLRESNPKTRACAARQLGYLGPDAQDAVPHLIQLLYDEKNKQVWGHVEDGLWAIGPGRTTENLNDSMARRSELLEMIQTPNVSARLYATFALGYYKPVSNPKTIVQALIAATNDQDGLVRWMAVKGLGRLGPLAVEAVPVLSKFLQTGDKAIRVQSTLALRNIGPAAVQAVPALMNQLYGDDYDLYLISAIALAQIGPVILPMLEQEIKAHPFHVLEVLEHLGADGVPLITKALRIPNKDVRLKAIEIIQFRGLAAEPAVPLLVNALEDKDIKIRQDAAFALTNLGPVAKAAVPALIVRLRDKDALVQCWSAEALGAIGPAAKAAVPKLDQMMKTPIRSDDDRSRRCAAKGLMKMSAETRALVPANMIKRVEEWDAMVKSTVTPLSRPDPTKPKPKQKDKPPPRSY